MSKIIFCILGLTVTCGVLGVSVIFCALTNISQTRQINELRSQIRSLG